VPLSLFLFDLRSRRSVETADTGLVFESAEIAHEGGRLLWRIPFGEFLGEGDTP
jgi:hypothetical protein